MHKFVVVGAGHAGLEAAFILSKLNNKVYLCVLDKNYVGNCPCNPSVGGPAKGIVTREIDALGGMQAKAADNTALQRKILNSSKGPGVQCLRFQIDKVQYKKWFLKQIEDNENIELVEGEVTSILTDKNTAKGVIVNADKKIEADAVIITTGTYLKSLTFHGKNVNNEGPEGFKNSTNLSDWLKEVGFELIRLKTGTPPRIKKDSINYSDLQIEPGNGIDLYFSHWSKERFINYELPCYLIHTNEKIHKLINDNLQLSAMYSGNITGVGPRYCPSIEDKIVRFSDKSRHQVFIEPESLELDTVYLSGFSSSLDISIQDKIIHLLPGLEKAEVVKYGYAIEYDAINPIQLYPSLESKLIKNLFFAGQINGTSGYEEAAAQGLIAGINANQKINNKELLVLSRDEAYIGVMIDDIVTKGVTDPYRLLTSRAEYRLLLRNDNALERLIHKGYEIGTITKEQLDSYNENLRKKNELIEFLKDKKIGMYSQLRAFTNNTNFSLYDFLKRPEIKLVNLLETIKFDYSNFDEELLKNIEITVKYEGYINKEIRIVNSLKNLENIKIPEDIVYRNVQNLSIEAIDKLNKIRPFNLAQAKRISGINLADIISLKTHLEQNA
ncbi:tRNA uridine-5-carboxymethylaminomethyl(34) synthesis enzyme MnmG [Mycoplasma sp. T363T]|uniref:tRNA uridine-5-carboxymethylaminomethyl(34) synthesis enzyme MnmG n=1 Tax=Mycoplasma bradburyae TaxID=2963128 RepID=UPI0023404936|nr:tRNA uridine-5-carboxymethylaminomethyl(34) synthesis enzyme MnmG [Mycoplasma bradburyae]MDC4163589.1 tRNA uridine-5-carboxymethylaminomethyl(34) synthesis enzyme MnmG [Mycoplasma bradburyae]